MSDHTEAYLRLVAEAKKSVREIGVDELPSLSTGSGPYLLVDVREESEWNSGHAEGAVHLGRGVIEQRIQDHASDPATPVVLYCAGGNRSALAAESLQKLGYTCVYSLRGGFRAWLENRAASPAQTDAGSSSSEGVPKNPTSFR